MRAIHEEPEKADICALHLHREEAGGGEEAEDEVAVLQSPEEETRRKRVDLLCKACRNPVTRSDYRIAVAGKHQHVFFNPHGIVFEVGCFSRADGAVASGTATLEFTWFDGYAWSIAVCGACLDHLGWLYRSESGSGFYGLIVTKLVEGASQEGS